MSLKCQVTRSLGRCFAIGRTLTKRFELNAAVKINSHSSLFSLAIKGDSVLYFGKVDSRAGWHAIYSHIGYNATMTLGESHYYSSLFLITFGRLERQQRVLSISIVHY